MWEIMKTVVDNQVDPRIKDPSVIALYVDIKDQGVRNQWVDSTNKWRLPFWDWALTDSNHQNAVPIMCTKQFLDIVRPEPSQKDTHVLNPLWAYPGDGMSMGDPSRGDHKIDDEATGRLTPALPVSHSMMKRIGIHS